MNALAHIAETKSPRVRGKLRLAIDKAVEEGLHWPDAAKAVGFTPRSMRRAMERAHVLAYIRQKRRLMREEFSTRNEHRLAEIRDQNDNRMAAVAAIKTLEHLSEDTRRAGVNLSIAITPGIVVDLGAQRPPGLINHNEIIELNPIDEVAGDANNL